MKAKFNFFFIVFLFFAIGCPRAATITWTNTAGGNWSVTNNWTPNQVPGSSDDAVITASGTYIVTLDASATVASLTLGGTSGTQSFLANANTLTLNGASTVGSNGAFNLGGGTLSGTGSFTVNGPFSWSNGTVANTGGVTLNGTSSLSGVGSGTMSLNGLLINGGSLTWSGSGNNLYFYGGTLTNLAAGTLTITADVSALNGGGGGTLGNAGTLKKTTTTGTTTIGSYVEFINSGDVQVQSGTLDVTGGGSATGMFEVSANATLQFDNVYTLNSASSVTGAGTVLMSAGTVTLTGTVSLSGTNIISGGTLAVNTPASMAVTNLILSSGTLSGNGPLAVNGPFSWSNGTVANTGGVTLNGTSSLSGVGSGTMSLNGLLINGGSLTWSGSGNNLYFYGGTLTNLAAGTLTITADVSALNGGGGGTLGNAGTLKKTTTTGTTTIGSYVEFINSGDVQVQSGTLDVTGGGSATGMFEVSANATLQFDNVYTLNSASSVTGAGTVLMSAGTVTLTGTVSLSGTNIISGGTLAVNTPASMAVTNLILSSGTLSGNGPLAVNGPFSWSNGTVANTGGVTLNGTSSLSGVGSGTMSLNGLLINGGSLTWSGSGNNLYFYGGTLTNLAAGTLTITADVSALNGGGGGTLGNAGTLKKTTTTGTTTIGSYVEFINSGDVQVQSGTLDVTGGGSATGMFEVSANATLQFDNVYTLNSASSVTGAGTVLMSAGTVTLTGTVSLSGTNIISGGTLAVNTPASMAVTNLILSSGTLSGNGPLAVNGPFSWSNGTVANTGGVTLNGTSSLSGVGSGTMSLNGLLINGGSLTWSGSGNNLYFYGGTLTNLAAGTLTITADVSALNGSGGGTLGNAGTLKKTTTTGTTTIGSYVEFINNGTLDVQSGTISLAGTHILTNGTLNFGISSATNFGMVDLSGAAALTGTLSANFNAGFLPAVTNSWQIINYTLPSGVFTQTNLPPAAVWTVTTNPTSLTISVLKLVPQLTWTNPANIVYGTALSSAQLDATAKWNGSTVPGSFTYNPLLGTILQSGSNQTLSVSFAPSDPTTYTNAATTVTINVQKAPLGVTATNKSKIYGQNITFTGTGFVAAGLVNGDSVTSASLASAGAISNAPVSGSPYAITITNALGDAGLTNYIIAYTNGLLTVNKAALGITATNRSKTYGQNLTFAGTEFSSSGLQNAETIGTVTLTSAGAISNAPVSGSPYSIVPSAATGGTFTPGNYAITYTNGTLTVNKALLGITANSRGKTYGQNIIFAGTEFVSSPLQNAETIGTVTLTSAGAISNAPVSGSPYSIVPNAASGGTFTPGNYAITYTNGVLTVSPASLGISASNRVKIYGQTVTFAGTEFSASGLQNLETVGTVTLTSAGTISNAPVGSSPYSIVPSAATGGTFTPGNYTIGYTNGALTVNKATLTITANSTNKIVGETLTFAGTEFTTSGLQNSETIGMVTLTSGGAVSTAPAGPYNIVPSAPVGGTFSQGNYSDIFVNGTLTVLGAPELTLTALGSQYVLSFPSVSGQIYQMQSKTNLALAAWSSLGGTINGTGGTVNVTNSIAVPQSFFQLQIMP
jgi:urease beta subunit